MTIRKGSLTRVDPRYTNQYYYTIRPKVCERANGMCYACAKPVGKSWRCHHIRPVNRGGTNDLKNLVCLCISCHDFVHRDFFYKRKLGRRQCFVGVNPLTGRKQVQRWFKYYLVLKRPSPRAAPILRKLCRLAGETPKWMDGSPRTRRIASAETAVIVARLD
jgi:HNH endonuclease